MKKRILSLALSGFLALSATFGLAACKPQNGGNTGGTNNGANGGSGNNNSSTNDNATIKPGTVITDKGVTGAIYSALSKAELSGLTYSGSLNFSVTEATATNTQKVSLEGAVQFDESAEGDAYLSIDGDGLLYLLGFLRSGGVYYTLGEAEGETVDFSALKQQLKAKDPIVLDKTETGISSILAAPATVKLLKNAVSLIDGVVTKTEGGYSLSFDLVSGAESLLEGAQAVAEAIDETVQMTLTGFFSQTFVEDTLTTLLGGITAAELAEFFELLPEGIRTALPEPGKESAKEYLLGLLRSGNFYTAAAGEGEPWSKYKTFGEVPLAELVSLISGGEVDLATLQLKEMLKEFAEELENKAVSLLLRFVSVEGNVTDEDVDLSVMFSFDDDKKLLGLTLDALAEGNVTKSETEQQPDGGTSPEDGNGDEMKTAAAPMTKVHFALKMNAACAQSPELFDLKGCKYRDENGSGTIK